MNPATKHIVTHTHYSKTQSVFNYHNKNNLFNAKHHHLKKHRPKDKLKELS